METRLTQVLAALVVVLASVLALGPGTARAQARLDGPIVATPGRLVSSHDAHLLAEEELALEAPRPEDYALPVVGVVLGGAALVGGGVPLVIGLLVMPFTVDDGGPNDRLTTMVVIGGLAAVAGGVILGVSIGELVGLRRRSRAAARSAELSSLYVLPTPDGFSAGLAGTF